MLPIKSFRRRNLLRKPMPAAWFSILVSHFPYYQRLSAAEQLELQQRIQIFIAEKNFEGCAGLEIDDEIRVTVASHACLLLLGRNTDIYPGVQSVLVYPNEYLAKAHHPVGEGFQAEYQQSRLGEAWK